MNCSCQICQPKDAKKNNAEKEDKKKEEDAIQGASSGEVTRVWVGTGAKVAPQQVVNYIYDFIKHLNCQHKSTRFWKRWRIKKTRQLSIRSR